MKKKILMVSALAVTLAMTAGCQSKVEKSDSESNNQTTQVQMSDSDDYIAGEDDCHNYMMDGATPMIVAEQNGYYFAKDGLLMYYDKNVDKTVYVCNKPDCQHRRDEDYGICNASVFDNDNRLYCYKDNLYTITNTNDMSNNNIFGHSLTKVSLDGSEREVLYTFMNYGEEGICYETCIHRGYLYYVAVNPDSSKKNKAIIYRRALVKDAEEEIFYESEEHYGVFLGGLRGYGNELYFDESGFYAKDSEEYNILKKCNIHNKESKDIRENLFGYYERCNGKLYLIDYDSRKVIECNEDTGEEKVLCDVSDKDDEAILKADKDYLYLYTWRAGSEGKCTLQILDYEGNQVDYMEDIGNFVGGDDDYLFTQKWEDVLSEDGEQTNVTERMFYYPKDAVGSGDSSLWTEMKVE